MYYNMGKKTIVLLLAGLGFFFLKWKEELNISLSHQPYVEKSELPTASTGPLETGPSDNPSPLRETRQSTPSESAKPNILKTNEPPAVVVPANPSNTARNILIGAAGSIADLPLLAKV